MTHLLEVTNVHKYFGGVRAVQGVSLTVQEGRVVGLIGPNGSGKSTLLNVVAGGGGAPPRGGLLGGRRGANKTPPPPPGPGGGKNPPKPNPLPPRSTPGKIGGAA